MLTIFVPLVTNYDSLKTNVDHIREAPSAQNIFGTDELGRDLFNRLWAGARISLMIGVATMMISVMIGTIVGAVAGYYGGAVDNVLMRFTDFMLSIPQLFLTIDVRPTLANHQRTGTQRRTFPIILIIGVLSWMGIARLVRGEFLALRSKDFVEASRALGATDARLIFRHILPTRQSFSHRRGDSARGRRHHHRIHVEAPRLRRSAADSTRGNMLKNAQAQMTYAPWTAIFPGLAIFITVLAINYVGDGLRDALDPRTIVKTQK